MSTDTIIVECEICEQSFSSNVINGNFQYVLADGTHIHIRRDYGWCADCEKMVAIEDISGNDTLRDINQRKTWLDQATSRSNKFFWDFWEL